MDNQQLKSDQISIIALDDSKLEGIAGGGSVSSVTKRHDENKRRRQAAEAPAVVLSDEELEDIAGGVLDKDIASEWMDEVAYARFKANMTFEEVMAALAETDYSFSQQDLIELEGIARMIYNYK